MGKQRQIQSCNSVVGMNLVEFEHKPTIGRISAMETCMKYMPVLLVAGIIIGEVCGLQFVFFPIYFKNSFLLRFICTTPIYFGIVLLTWSWIMAITTDPGVILTNGDLTTEQITHVKNEGLAHPRRVIAIKKYLSINPEAFEKH